MTKHHLFERLAWIAGSALIAIWAVYWVHSQVGRRSDLQAFERAKATLEAVQQPVDSSASPSIAKIQDLSADGEVDFSLWAEGRVKGYEESLVEHLGAPQAILRIPKLGLEVAVHEGTSDLVLNRGVGRIEGTANIGEGSNLGLAGHRDGFFRGLKDLETGDTMTLETLTGTETYLIDNISIVSPEDVYVLAPSEEPRITLVTCYPFYFVGKAPLRYIVHARETNTNEERVQVDLDTSG